MWAVASQGLDSLSNFFLSVWVARAVSAHQFGAFGTVYVALTMVTIISRAAANMPMMVVYAASSWRFSRKIASDTMGASLAVGLAASVLAVAVGVPLGGVFRPLLLVTAVIAPGLVLQDSVCYIFIARQRPQAAFLNNAVWFAAQLALFLPATLIFHSRTAWVFLALWGLGAYVSVAVSLVQLRTVPRVQRARRWFEKHRGHIVDMVVESSIIQGAQQAVIYVLAFGVDLVGVAAFRAASVPLGLLRVFLQGLTPIGMSEGARMYERSPRRMAAFIEAWAVAGVLLNLGLGVVLVVMPRSVGATFLGDSWAYARPIVMWVAVAAAAGAAIFPVQAGLRALKATRTSLKMRIPLVVLQLGGTAAGVVVNGLTGAAIGYAVGSAAGAVVAHTTFRHTFRAVSAGRAAPAGVTESARPSP